MKKFIIDISNINKCKFAIKKITKGGVIRYLPVVKERGLFSSWTPIVKVYDEYIAMNHDHGAVLTEDECAQHIIQFANILKKREKELLFETSIKEIQVALS